MSVNINGKITFFVRWYGQEGKKYPVATATLKRNWGDKENPEFTGSKSIQLEFDQSFFPEEKVRQLKEDVSYTIEVSEGFLSLRKYNKQGKSEPVVDFVLHISKGRLTKGTPVDIEKRNKALEEARAKKGGSATPESPMEIQTDLPF